MARENVIGRIYGRLTVTEDLPNHIQPSGQACRRVRCRCTCGESIDVRLPHIKSGHTSSCGCYKKELDGTLTKTHGMSGTRTYVIWCKMVGRGTGKCDQELYADRGITVCESWLKFENFFADMGEAPEGRSIDRVDGDRGYEQKHCRWATTVEQARNQRSSIRVDYGGRNLILRDLADELGLDSQLVYHRYTQLGWTLEKSLSTKKNPNLKLYTYKGETLCIAGFCEKYGITMSNLSQRLGKLGWSIQKAIETPIGLGGPGKKKAS